MSTRIRNFFRYNIGYKIAAFMLAGALWLMVYNLEDPTKTTTYTIPVTIVGSDAIEEMNKVYEIVGGTGQVTVAISAKRTTLEKISSTDFTATADMSRLVIADNGRTGTVPISISTGRYSGSVKLTSREKYLEISLEDLTVKQFVVAAATKGNVAEGYALGNVTVENPNVIKVSGPSSAVQSVDKVIAPIDVEGMSQDISDNVVPILLDENGEEINNNRLELSNTTVTVQAVILNTKEAAVHVGVSGIPADGYYVHSVQVTPENIMVKGSVSALNRLSEISVPASVLDVTGAAQSIETTIDLSEYLPEGVELLDKTQSSVQVEVEILQAATRNYVLPVSEIAIIGLAENREVQYNSSSVNIIVSGKEADLNQLSASDIKGTADVSAYTAGVHHVPVILNLDEEKYDYMTVRMSLTIIDKESEDSE